MDRPSARHQGSVLEQETRTAGEQDYSPLKAWHLETSVCGEAPELGGPETRLESSGTESKMCEPGKTSFRYWSTDSTHMVDSSVAQC